MKEGGQEPSTSDPERLSDARGDDVTTTAARRDRHDV
jgi:hypothetical protein